MSGLVAVPDMPPALQAPRRSTLRQVADTQAERPSSTEPQDIRTSPHTDILNSLPANVAILDAAGFILAVNESWREFATLHDWQTADHGVGSNYLAACDRVLGEESVPASRASAGIRRYCKEFKRASPRNTCCSWRQGTRGS